tara:strand:+ start:18 stop:611 length:594 start_codon:yes stop_codon:yes gene_type:complete
MSAKPGAVHNVNRAISILVNLGYLTIRKDGQSNHYAMSTRIQPDNTATGIQPDTGRPPGSNQRDTWTGIQPDIEPSLAGYSICDEPREGGAFSAPLTIIESGDRAARDHDLDDQDSAPLGAVLNDDQAELAAICFPHLNEQDQHLLEKLADTVGPNKLTIELVNLGLRRQAGNAMLELPDWVRAVSLDVYLGAGHPA